MPTDAGEEEKSDETETEGIDELGTGSGTDDETTPDSAAARKAYFPSSIGLSLLVPKDAKELRVTIRWGDYLPDGIADVKDLMARLSDLVGTTGEAGTEATSLLKRWRRKDRVEELTLKVPASACIEKPKVVPNSGGLEVVLAVRPVKDIPAFDELVPKGTRSVAVFVVNRRRPLGEASVRDATFIFQAGLEVRSDSPFVARPNLRGLESEEWDERVADLQYQDVCEYAVGHGIATHATLDEHGECREVRTRWIPAAEVERVAPAKIDGVTLEMEKLAALADAATAGAGLSPIVTHYRAWIEEQRAKVPNKPRARKETAQQLIANANVAAKRIETGIKLLADPLVLEAFRTANKVMAQAARRRSGRLVTPYSSLSLGQRLGGDRARPIAQRLEELDGLGMQPEHIALVMEAIANARASRPLLDDQIELVWTGPETTHALNRDTAVVIRELFGQATESVVVAGFAVYQGRDVFRTLAERMSECPTLQVRLYLNVQRGFKDTSLESEIIRRFARKFVDQDWPFESRLPEVFYDPRSLETDLAKRSSLHAKCVIVDRRISLVTSANFTQAAQERNIEAGVVIRSQRFAARLADHFGALADTGELVRMGLPRLAG